MANKTLIIVKNVGGRKIAIKVTKEEKLKHEGIEYKKTPVEITPTQRKNMALQSNYNMKKYKIYEEINCDVKFKEYLIKELKVAIKNTMNVYLNYNTTHALDENDVSILSYRVLDCVTNPCYMSFELYKY